MPERPTTVGATATSWTASSSPFGVDSLEIARRELRRVRERNAGMTFEEVVRAEHGFGTPPRLRTAPRRKMTEKEKMQDRVQLYLNGGRDESGLTEDEVTVFLNQEKKTRHLGRNEREGIHKPIQDGKLKTVELDVSDLVPA